ncbi:MAG TPA: isoprenylcysteine carboxylmethyltransferase family protein [Candidatus Binatia bacterium]|nr:isoprenylcysteine carboxylmethyltransferase family protein [Candidatus Binatia bacterium]
MTSEPTGERVPRRPAVVEALGRVGVLLLLGLVLVVGPLGMSRLNDALGWPRWRVPGGRVLAGAIVAGVLALWLHASNLFVRVGHGTPFVTAPPRRLVTVGLYAHSRNPIYVGHVALLCAWFLGSGRVALLLYAAAVWAVIQAGIVWLEEPQLLRRFGAPYAEYTATVPRWLLLRPRRSR